MATISSVNSRNNDFGTSVYNALTSLVNTSRLTDVVHRCLAEGQKLRKLQTFAIEPSWQNYKALDISTRSLVAGRYTCSMDDWSMTPTVTLMQKFEKVFQNRRDNDRPAQSDSMSGMNTGMGGMGMGGMMGMGHIMGGMDSMNTGMGGMGMGGMMGMGHIMGGMGGMDSMNTGMDGTDGIIGSTRPSQVDMARVNQAVQEAIKLQEKILFAKTFVKLLKNGANIEPLARAQPQIFEEIKHCLWKAHGSPRDRGSDFGGNILRQEPTALTTIKTIKRAIHLWGCAHNDISFYDFTQR